MPKGAETVEVGSAAWAWSVIPWLEKTRKILPSKGRWRRYSPLGGVSSQQRMQNEDEEAEGQGGHDEEDACDPKGFFVTLKQWRDFSRDLVGEVQHVAQSPTDIRIGSLWGKKEGGL